MKLGGLGAVLSGVLRLTHAVADARYCFPLPETGDAAAASGDTLGAQLAGHTRAPIELMALAIDGVDLRLQAGILDGAQACLAGSGGIETARGDSKQGAHHLDRVGVPVCLDKGESRRL